MTAREPPAREARTRRAPRRESRAFMAARMANPPCSCQGAPGTIGNASLGESRFSLRSSGSFDGGRGGSPGTTLMRATADPVNAWLEKLGTALHDQMSFPVPIRALVSSADRGGAGNMSTQQGETIAEPKTATRVLAPRRYTEPLNRPHRADTPGPSRPARVTPDDDRRSRTVARVKRSDANLAGGPRRRRLSLRCSILGCPCVGAA